MLFPFSAGNHPLSGGLRLAEADYRIVSAATRDLADRIRGAEFSGQQNIDIFTVS
ncbi:MAG: hypothetical protein ACI9JL_000016 [Paracoccaceae bacterium]|jgi:hypothetical protein